MDPLSKSGGPFFLTKLAPRAWKALTTTHNGLTNGRPPERSAGGRDDLQAEDRIAAPRGACSDDESLPVEWTGQTNSPLGRILINERRV